MSIMKVVENAKTIWIGMLMLIAAVSWAADQIYVRQDSMEGYADIQRLKLVNDDIDDLETVDLSILTVRERVKLKRRLREREEILTRRKK